MKIADECRAQGAQEVIALVKDLAIPEACTSVINETVDHFKGKKKSYFIVSK